MAASPISFSPFPNRNPVSKSHPFPIVKKSFCQSPRSPNLKLRRPLIVPSAIRTNNNDNNNGRFGGDGGGGSDGGDNDRGKGSRGSNNRPDLFMVGHPRSRCDSELPFEVVMKEVLHVSATAVGDMATRPNFGLGKLGFVFSTLIVGSIIASTLFIASLIMNSTLLRAPTSISSPTSSSSSLEAPKKRGGGFEPGSCSFDKPPKKGVGGEAKKKKKKGSINAATWSVHMGLSINLSWLYQTLNAFEFLMAKSMPPVLFKAAAAVLRDVAGGMSFVMLGRFMG